MNKTKDKTHLVVHRKIENYILITQQRKSTLLEKNSEFNQGDIVNDLKELFDLIENFSKDINYPNIKWIIQ
jgi:hypothetical protein